METLLAWAALAVFLTIFFLGITIGRG